MKCGAQPLCKQRRGQEAEPLPWSKVSVHSIRNPFLHSHSLCLPAPAVLPVKNDKIHRVSTFCTLSEGESTKHPASQPSSPETHSQLAERHSRTEKSSSATTSEEFATPDLLASIETYQRALTPDLRGWFAMLHTVSLPTDEELAKRRLLLSRAPDEAGMVSLFLDLDETLVHVVREAERKLLPKSVQERLRKVEVLNNGEIAELQFLVRPGVEAFLSSLAEIFDVSVSFTPSNFAVVVHGQRRQIRRSTVFVHRPGAQVHQTHSSSRPLHKEGRQLHQGP